MRRCFLAVAAVATLITFSGCGGNKSTPNPATMILISPSSASLNTGGVQTFSAQAFEADGITPATTQPEITFSVSGSSVTLTKSANNSAVACAGTWDANFIVCTPGPSTSSTVTASGGGLTSAPLTVFVHPKVDKVTLSPASLSTCTSAAATQQFTATALSNGTDVTSSVGTINWVSTATTVATIDANGLTTAVTPGATSIFANVGNVTSLPVSFTTCPPASISLHVQNATDTSFTLAAAATQQLTADVTDTKGNPIANASLTYSVLPSAVGSVTSTGLASAVLPGVGQIVASCTPPTCNVNIGYPVYSNLVTMNVSGTSTPTIYAVSMSGTSLVPIDSTGTVGTAIALPAGQTPNSMVIAATGLHAYLGSSAGLMPVDTNANTVGTTVTAALGKVLAVSPGEKKVITADASHAYVVDLTNNNAVTTLAISGATAAAFTPDDFEAYIAAGNNLFVYSTQFTLRNFNIGAAVNDVTFLTSGLFAYTANANSSSSAVRSCDIPAPPPASGPTADKVPTNGVPLLVRSLPNDSQVILADSPGVDVLTPAFNAGGGCGLGLSNDHTFVDFSIGAFTPHQIIALPNSSAVFIVTDQQVLRYNSADGTTAAIPLANGATPTTGGATLDSASVYVGGSDGKVHRIDVTNNTDAQQIDPGLGSVPDLLVAVRPH